MYKIFKKKKKKKKNMHGLLSTTQYLSEPKHTIYDLGTRRNEWVIHSLYVMHSQETGNKWHFG